MENLFKKSSPTQLRLLTILILLMIIPACDEPRVGPDTGQNLQNLPKDDSHKIGPDGGIIKALNGNVMVQITEGALTDTEKFTIKEGPRDDGDDFIIKSIIVKPQSVVFAIPAKLRLRYDGKLSIGTDPCKAKCLVLYHFENDAAFDKRMPSDMVWINKCYVNITDQCLETEIYSGGVFAIGEESLGKKAPDPS